MYIQTSEDYILKCDKCGYILHKANATEAYHGNINDIVDLAKSYGWTVTNKTHKCTYCKTFK
jgi:hypothetical protein